MKIIVSNPVIDDKSQLLQGTETLQPLEAFELVAGQIQHSQAPSHPLEVRRPGEGVAQKRMLFLLAPT